MFSSKIIKQKDKEKTAVRSFSLQQFPCKEDDNIAHQNQQKSKDMKKHIDAAHELKARAQQEATLVIESARREAMRIQQQAYERGFAEGLQEGRARGEAEFSFVIKSLQTIDAEFLALKKNFFDDHQNTILELALKIARSIVHQEIRTQNDVVVQILIDAINLAMDRERLKIRIHPDDLSICLERRPDILKSCDGIKQIIFEPDETINKGGALIEYSFGEIDARIEEQFLEIERGLRNVQQASQDAHSIIA